MREDKEEFFVPKGWGRQMSRAELPGIKDVLTSLDFIEYEGVWRRLSSSLGVSLCINLTTASEMMNLEYRPGYVPSKKIKPVYINRHLGKEKMLLSIKTAWLEMTGSELEND